MPHRVYFERIGAANFQDGELLNGSLVRDAALISSLEEALHDLKTIAVRDSSDKKLRRILRIFTLDGAAYVITDRESAETTPSSLGVLETKSLKDAQREGAKLYERRLDDGGKAMYRAIDQHERQQLERALPLRQLTKARVGAKLVEVPLGILLLHACWFGILAFR
jgi:hypothetical protein